MLLDKTLDRYSEKDLQALYARMQALYARMQAVVAKTVRRSDLSWSGPRSAAALLVEEVGFAHRLVTKQAPVLRVSAYRKLGHGLGMGHANRVNSVNILKGNR